MKVAAPVTPPLPRSGRDAAPMALVEVRRLLEFLLTRGFSVDQYVDGGPFADLAEKKVHHA